MGDCGCRERRPFSKGMAERTWGEKGGKGVREGDVLYSSGYLAE